ncbi:MAG: hypothetical protein AAF502_06315 [Bacteroidota bacterium]
MEKVYQIWTAEHDNCKYKIEEDSPTFGWYVFRYNKRGVCTHDYVQHDLEMAISFAEMQFSVPKENWKQEK